MFSIRPESPLDVPGRERLLDRCFGASRFTKTCERLRAGRMPADGLAAVVDRVGTVAATSGVAATVRLWNVEAGSAGAALLLGPIAVDPALHGLGVGSKLMRHVLDRARELGHRAVVLVGDAPYYERFGFAGERVAGLTLPGPFERARFLGLDLVAGALDGASGVVAPTGRAMTRAALPVADLDSLDLEFAAWNRLAA